MHGRFWGRNFEPWAIRIVNDTVIRYFIKDYMFLRRKSQRTMRLTVCSLCSSITISGFVHATSILGPALGYLLGGYFLSIYVDPGVDPERFFFTNHVLYHCCQQFLPWGNHLCSSMVLQRPGSYQVLYSWSLCLKVLGNINKENEFWFWRSVTVTLSTPLS